MSGTTDQRLYHGTRRDFEPGDLIEPGGAPPARVFLTPSLDAATWDAELAEGDGAARVYLVEPTGPIEEASDAGEGPPARPSMTWRSAAPLRVIGEVTEWPLYHGTRADLKPGDLIAPGYAANFGSAARRANHVYMTRTLDAAKWGAELAVGEGPGRIYLVETTGPVEDDPNLTDKKFRGNPTRSFRSREPLRVVAEVLDWKGHPPEAVRAMREGLEELERRGLAAIDD